MHLGSAKHVAQQSAQLAAGRMEYLSIVHPLSGKTVGPALHCEAPGEPADKSTDTIIIYSWLDCCCDQGLNAVPYELQLSYLCGIIALGAD